MSEHTKTTAWGVQRIMLMKYYLMHNGECVESGVCHAEIVLSRLTSFFSHEYLIQIHQSWFPQPCTNTYSLGPVYLLHFSSLA